MKTVLDFERPIAELEGKLSELQHLSDRGDLNIADEVIRLKTKVEKMLTQTYTKLTPWQKVQVARHPERPHFQDFIENYNIISKNQINTEFFPINGIQGV